jgi:aminoglycoside phosphotransferase (APT) family kinase protein
VLVSDDGTHLSGVLDFGDARVGDPAVDFIWQCTNVGRYDSFEKMLGAGALEVHLEAYGAAAHGFAGRARAYEQQRLFNDVLGDIHLAHQYLEQGIKTVEERARGGA